MERPALSLNGREQQALDSITGRLAGSDPRLAAMLTGFTRLASGEEMPPHERIRAGNEARRTAGPGRRLGLQWAAVLLSLLTAIAVIAVTLALNHGRKPGTCTTFWYTACANSAPAHSSRPGSQ
jgi:hypothetical protein